MRATLEYFDKFFSLVHLGLAVLAAVLELHNCIVGQLYLVFLKVVLNVYVYVVNF